MLRYVSPLLPTREPASIGCDFEQGNVFCSADPRGELHEPHQVHFMIEDDWEGGGVGGGGC